MSTPLPELDLCSPEYQPERYIQYRFMWMPTFLTRTYVSGMRQVINRAIANNQTSLVFGNDAEPTCDALRYLVQELMVDSSITSLTFEGYHFKAKGLEILLPLLNRGHIQVLKLRGTEIGDEGAAKLAQVLALNTSLKHLDLTKNNITVDGIKYLADGLKNNDHLRELNLQYNSLGVDGVKILMKSIRNTITLLDLSRCGVGDIGLKYIADRLTGTIDKDDCSMDDSSMEEIGEIEEFREFNETDSLCVIQTPIETSEEIWQLKFLRLECNQITAIGMNYLVEACKINPHLRGLDIEFNYLYDVGLDSLMNMMLAGRQFDYLNLCLTQPQEIALSKLNDILEKKNCQIIDLNLNQAVLGGCVYNGVLVQHNIGMFVPCLSSNSSLKRLTLRCTRLRDADFNLLAKNLELNTNSALTQLDLGCNYVRSSDALNSHPSLLAYV